MGKARGHLADVASVFMHGLEETLEPFVEDVVAFRATKAAGLLEVGLGESAAAADELVLAHAADLNERLLAHALEHVGQGETGGVGDALLVSTALAEVHLLQFPFGHLA